jgi:bifunctional non-homologous end joining protein LigD
MAAKVVEQLPEGEQWLYEVKWDGYGALLMKDGDHISIRSRNNKES